MSHWSDRAACKGLTDVMFPVRGDWQGVERAKAICATCPVIDSCLEWISRNPERYGIWAGIAGKEITEERKRREIIPNKAKHGTRGKYIAGCRCEHCTEANAEYNRSRRHSTATGVTHVSITDAITAVGDEFDLDDYGRLAHRAQRRSLTSLFDQH